MRLEIVTIGHEILSGRTLNTNVTWMSHVLSQAGFPVKRHTTLPDTPAALKKGLERSLAEMDCVITTGGLGPTCDDLTRDVAAELMGEPLVFRPEVAEDLERRFGKDLKSLQHQATLPLHAELFRNLIGTAYGIALEKEGRFLILLPGVPAEMQSLCRESVLPFLKKHYVPEPLIYEHLHFYLLYESLVDPELCEIQKMWPEVNVGIYPDYGKLTVSLSSKSQEALRLAKNHLIQIFHPYYFVASEGKIAEALQRWMIEHGKKLACAESCTGGMVSSLITEVSGSSAYFEGSLVTYSNALKHSLLGVKLATLENHGAVSIETVIEMLQGLFSCTQADYGMAVSGIAGPSGGLPGKPVGTVFAAIGRRGQEPDVGHFMVHGSRSVRIQTTSQRLLGALLRKVSHGISAFPLYP